MKCQLSLCWNREAWKAITFKQEDKIKVKSSPETILRPFSEVLRIPATRMKCSKFSGIYNKIRFQFKTNQIYKCKFSFLRVWTLVVTLTCHCGQVLVGRCMSLRAVDKDRHVNKLNLFPSPPSFCPLIQRLNKASTDHPHDVSCGLPFIIKLLF